MRKARLNSKAIKHIKKENRWLLVLLLIAGFLLAFSIPLFFTKVISHANKTAPKIRAKASRSLIVSYRSILGLNKKVRICLLYTSPSPRDATLSRMPSSA